VSNSSSIFKYDALSGSIIWEKSISTNLKGVLTKNNLFLYSSNNLLICLDLNDGQVLWSKNTNKQIKNLYGKKLYNKIKIISKISIVDNKVFLFSKEGYLLTFNYKNGEIESVNRILKSGLGNDPIFANGYLYSLDNNNRLFQFR
jgi:outer membrane protein assembly factor BamB